jgi:uncharacterized protein (DUF1684 family)
MVFTGNFSPSDDARIHITSSVYHQLGVLRVEVTGSMYDLIVLDDGDGDPFFVFCDTTNGGTTYAGGR